MNGRRERASAVSRERLWTWTFWMSIVACEALGVMLAHQA